MSSDQLRRLLERVREFLRVELQPGRKSADAHELRLEVDRVIERLK